MSSHARLLSLFAALFLAFACRPEGPASGDGMGLALRFEAPGQECVAQGFIGWAVEVTSLETQQTTVAFVEPFAWTIEGSEVGLDGEAYLFGDYWHGLTAPGEYLVRAYGVIDDDPLTPAPFMTGDEAVVTVVAGATTEIALVVRCDVLPGGLDVIVLVEGSPVLLDFDIDEKWVAVCQGTTFTATLADDTAGAVTAEWTLADADGNVVLHQTDTFPAGTTMPVTTTFDAWLPTPGDYAGTLAISDSAGSTSVFTFPWHVRVPAIAVGACEDEGDPYLLLGCDTSDGLDAIDLVDDPACLAAAFGAAECVVPATIPTSPDTGVDDFVGPYLTATLFRGDVPAGSQWQVGLAWSDGSGAVTTPLEGCDIGAAETIAWEVTVTPGSNGTASVSIDVDACSNPLTTVIPWNDDAPLDTFVLDARAGAGSSSADITATVATVTDADGAHPIASGTVHAQWSPPAIPTTSDTCSSFGLPYGFKIDAMPHVGRYYITPAYGDLYGATPRDPTAWIDIERLYSESGRTYGFDFASSLAISGVKVKAQVYNTYTYDPPVYAGVRLETAQRKDISHVTFCWGPQGSAEADLDALGGPTCITGPTTFAGTLSWGGNGLGGDAQSTRLHLGRIGAGPATSALPACNALLSAFCTP